MEHIYKFESKTLSELIELRKQSTLEDVRTIDILVQKTKQCALEFAKTVDKKFISDYLDDNFPIGILCPLSLLCSRTGLMFSRSHEQWITELRRTKLTYDWGSSKQKKQNVERLWQSLEHLQNVTIKP